MSDEILRNLKEPSHWMRLLFMLGFTFVLYVAGFVMVAITLAQALFSLFTGADNRNLRNLGAAMATYVFEILQFLTYNSEVKPFPFAPFPLSSTGSSGEARTPPGPTPSTPEAPPGPGGAGVTAAAYSSSADVQTAGPAAPEPSTPSPAPETVADVVTPDPGPIPARDDKPGNPL